MTAYLKPGDKVHITMCIGAGTPAQMQMETQKLNKELREYYKKQGVEVLILTTTATAGEVFPTQVVAVFRAE